MVRRCIVVVPEHVGIIMDGNGRWATARGLDRTKGHLEGLKAARKVTRAASEAGVKVLSLYVFSTENWKRSTEEVGFLMGLVALHLEKEFDFYRELGLKVVHSGDREALSPEVRRTVDRVVAPYGNDSEPRAQPRWPGRNCSGGEPVDPGRHR